MYIYAYMVVCVNKYLYVYVCVYLCTYTYISAETGDGFENRDVMDNVPQRGKGIIQCHVIF